MNLRECYDGLKKLGPNLDIDSLDIVEEVAKMRHQWKPGKVRVVLLAESHAHTSQEDFATSWHIPDTIYKGKFVRFVYCLANGEKGLVPSVRHNKGTSQYWKIFYSCLNQISNNRDFGPVLQSTPFDRRIANKVGLLSKLKEAGIWLIDASIVGVNHLKHAATRKKLLRYCWQYTRPLIEDLDPTPEHLIVIGRLVERSLRKEIASMKIGYTILPQPQAHLPAPGYFPYYKTYYETCSKFRN